MFVPGPVYEIAGSMIFKKNISFTKRPRVTYQAEMMKRKEKIPAPGDYSVALKNHPLGNYKIESARSSFLDEMEYFGL